MAVGTAATALAPSRSDEFTTEVIRGLLVAITTEMKDNLMRAAHSPIVYEAEDFTVGLFDDEGNTISIGLGLPMFIRGLSEAIKAKIAHWGKDNIHPGDVLLTNDPQVHGSHNNHLIFSMPVFNAGELMGFASSMAHWPDVGGVLGGLTRDTYSEGIQIPFVKVFHRGVADHDVLDLVRANCRVPEQAAGDLRAQLGAGRTGELRLSALLARYGNATFRSCVRQIFDSSERLARAAVRDICDGVYEAEAFMDDDGVQVGKPIRVAVRVIVRGDQMTVDLSGVAAEVSGFYNSGAPAGRSAAQVAFKFLTSPLLEPINDGSFRAVDIVLPPGRVISATRGAAFRRWMTIPMTVIDCIFRALAPACPDRVMAAHHADIGRLEPYTFIDPDTGGYYLTRKGNSLGGIGGGFGAVHGSDGQSGTKAINDGDTHNTPIEAGEAKGPLVARRRCLRQDSGGPGRWRGGLGELLETEVRVPAMVHSNIERTICAPWGLFGGKEALPNKVWLRRQDTSEQYFASGKVNPTRLEAGDACVTAMGGGGGYGNPLEREPWRVLADVRGEYVSLESAERDYGVVIRHPAPRQYLLDVEGTSALRTRLAQSQPTTTPT